VFCGAVERGSHTLITFTTSPTKIIVAVLILALLVRFLVGRTEWDEVPLRPIDRRRRAGQILRAAVRTYRSSPRVFILFGLAFIPAAIVTGVLAKLIEMVPFVSSITSLAGRASGTSIVLAALVGSIANIAAIVVVNAAVATYLESDRRGVAAGIDALRSTWDRRRALTGGFVRSFAVVFVLLATVVGAPWGIWQLVRYQFVPQTIVLEGATGASSLDHSTRLVRGRWLHTAIFVAVLNGAVGALALVIGLLLLVVASGIPLWAFSGMVTLVYALVVPMVSIAMTLLYGDARAQHTARDAPDADELVPASVS
jgi:hypothetical protein